MNNREIDRAIIDFLGYQALEHVNVGEGWMCSKKGPYDPSASLKCLSPTTDLNSAVMAWAKLTGSQKRAVERRLMLRGLANTLEEYVPSVGLLYILDATPLQLSTAISQVIGGEKCHSE